MEQLAGRYWSPRVGAARNKSPADLGVEPVSHG
uniref:Uncharacterized protein n=1 Tax=Arundo donax TaxID=35708 RepID=A0A0A8YCH4_ARUDO